ncbi:hypothetical protein BA897_00415 [Spiribacter roseus]|nr:hypothetical protein BA897_00415 [Spiribacter roseus]
MMELALDRGEIGEDVGVIKLQVVQDQGSRAKMHELRALIEEGGVVFIRLDDKERRAAEARRCGEVLGHATDQEARLEAGRFQQPGDQAGGGGLAVGAGHGDDPAPAEDVPGQPGRPRVVVETAVEHRLHRRVAP